MNIPARSPNTGIAMKAYAVGIRRTVKFMAIFILAVCHPEMTSITKKLIASRVRAMLSIFLLLLGHLSVKNPIVKWAFLWTATDMPNASIHETDRVFASSTHKSDVCRKVLHIIPATMMMKINKNKIPDIVCNTSAKVSKAFFISLVS
jgi:hypothetical protein